MDALNCPTAGGRAAIDPGLYANSSLREKVIEHVFIGELLRLLWRNGNREIEVLRAEVDRGGYDLVLECNDVIRHVQLKSSHRGAKTRDVKINLKLARKPSGCVIWVLFDQDTMDLGPFLWLGGKPDQKLPALGDKVARHTKCDTKLNKSVRANLRVVGKRSFEVCGTMSDIVRSLFGNIGG